MNACEHRSQLVLIKVTIQILQRILVPVSNSRLIQRIEANDVLVPSEIGT